MCSKKQVYLFAATDNIYVDNKHLQAIIEIAGSMYMTATCIVKLQYKDLKF